MTTSPVLEAALVDIAADGRRDRRARLRADVRAYVRSAADLFEWTFSPARIVVTSAIENPTSPAATKALCKALYRDWKIARKLPDYMVTKQMQIDNRRSLFACECELYRQQRNRYRRETMAGFFDNVVKPIGETPAGAE